MKGHALAHEGAVYAAKGTTISYDPYFEAVSTSTKFMGSASFAFATRRWRRPWAQRSSRWAHLVDLHEVRDVGRRAAGENVAQSTDN